MNQLPCSLYYVCMQGPKNVVRVNWNVHTCFDNAMASTSRRLGEVTAYAHLPLPVMSGNQTWGQIPGAYKGKEHSTHTISRMKRGCM